MSLSSDSAVLTMPVQPANTNGGNGFGFGNDGAWWIIILFLFAFCGGWGGNWGGNGNTGAGVVDGYVLTSDLPTSSARWMVSTTACVMASTSRRSLSTACSRP